MSWMFLGRWRQNANSLVDAIRMHQRKLVEKQMLNCSTDSQHGDCFLPAPVRYGQASSYTSQQGLMAQKNMVFISNKMILA